MLQQNNCREAFWVGNLKHKNTVGVEVRFMIYIYIYIYVEIAMLVCVRFFVSVCGFVFVFFFSGWETSSTRTPSGWRYVS